MNRFTVILFLVVAVSQVNGWSFWPFSSNKASSSNPNEGAHLSKSLVPFEMTDAEEAFLAEAQKYMGKMRPLDSCHQVVINRIKKSCSDINEEELAKLGVQLLNCQSLAENRKTYECTDDMSIAQCTSNMDSETWNSYHIISNRARSVCYATRQQQFRLKTEYTVNQLGKQAGEQLHLMDTLKTGQSKLVDLATDTVDKMTAGQKVLVSQQRRIHLTQVANQRTIENHVNKNIKTLSRENSLIDKNHAQLTSMAHTINNKLETATNLLKKQENNLKQSHSEVLHDLNDIRVKAQDVWYKLDESANHMLKNQNESANHYKDTIENLKRINKTISYLLDAIETTQSKLDDKITWLARQFGATGYQISTMVTVMLHAGYFLVATYGIVFVQAPVVTRVAVVIVVPGNALCEINFGTSLTFTHLTAVLVSVLIVNWTYIQFRRRRVSQPSTSKKELDTSWSPLAIRNLSNTNYKSPCTGTSCSHTPLSSTFNSTIISKQPSLSPTDTDTDAKRKLDLSSIFETSTSTPLKTSNESASTPLKNNNKSVSTPLKNNNKSVSTPLKNNKENVSTPLKNNKASTPGRGLNTPKRCTAVTKTGKACKKKTSNDSTVCSIHDISRS